MKGPYIFIAAFIVLFSYQAIAQSPGDALVQGNVNIPYLESLVKSGIDSVRKVHNLDPLANDSILYKAATLHARYLLDNKTLGHFEPGKKEFNAPDDRIKYFGGTSFQMMGENVAYSYILKLEKDPHAGKYTKPHISSTYRDAAHDLVMGWVHSPEHFKNIITRQYNTTGLAISYDPASNRIYGVQDFGKLVK